jgi:hypothetical protein
MASISDHYKRRFLAHYCSTLGVGLIQFSFELYITQFVTVVLLYCFVYCTQFVAFGSDWVVQCGISSQLLWYPVGFGFLGWARRSAEH